jgi:hypothetical protein
MSMLCCAWTSEPGQAGLLRSSVTSVGSTTPVADYLTLLSDTSEDMLVKSSKVLQHSLHHTSNTLQQLMRRIDDLVELYVGGPTEPFQEMVKVLRKACAKDEPAFFNTFCMRLSSAWSV